MKKQFLSLVTAAVTAVMTLAGTAMPGTADASTVSIMCIGDSITDGYGVAGSYRKFLYHDLTEAGFSVDMLGAKGGGWTPVYTDEITGESFSYDDENTGYSGYAIKAYDGRSGIYETLRETACLEQDPDIVILQIGTNDVIDCHALDQAGDRLTTLISYILDEISADAVLYVTTIPDLDPNRSDVYSWFGNYRHSADWQTSYSDEEVEAAVQQSVDQYNATVRETVQTLAAAHDNLRLGDVHSAITDVTTQLGDGVHPNNAGYKCMGDYWAGVIAADLSGNPLPTDEPTQEPTQEPTEEPTQEPTQEPTEEPTEEPTQEPTQEPTEEPTEEPTQEPTEEPTQEPTDEPTDPGILMGDVDENGTVGVSDVVLLQKYLVRQAVPTPGGLAAADVYPDGRVNVVDLTALRQSIFQIVNQ